MPSHAKLLGHPVHPQLVVFPLGLLSMALVFDVAYVVSGNAQLADFAYWAVVAGTIGGLAAAIFGFADWLAIPGGTRAKRIGLFHGAGNLLVEAAFVLSFIARQSDPAYLPNLAPLIWSLVGVGIAVVTAWLGGELVFRLGVGVDQGANVDAPNSLGGDVEGDTPA